MALKLDKQKTYTKYKGNGSSSSAPGGFNAPVGVGQNVTEVKQGVTSVATVPATAKITPDVLGISTSDITPNLVPTYTQPAAAAIPTTAIAPGSLSVDIPYAGIKLAAEQLANAQKIIDIGKARGIAPRDIQIAIATAFQESGLRNINYGDDAYFQANGLGAQSDSKGLFQQRPSQGWGTVEQVTNPEYAINKFYDVLLAVPNRDQKAFWEPAYAVQRPAYQYRQEYAKYENLARDLYNAYGGAATTNTPANSPVDIVPNTGTPDTNIKEMQKNKDKNKKGKVLVSGDYSKGHPGIDIPLPEGTPIVISGNTPVRVLKSEPDKGIMLMDNGGSKMMFAHLSQVAPEGVVIPAGHPVAISGNNPSGGYTTGPHLHIEMMDSMGGVIDPLASISPLVRGGALDLMGGSAKEDAYKAPSIQEYMQAHMDNVGAASSDIASLLKEFNLSEADYKNNILPRLNESDNFIANTFRGGNPGESYTKYAEATNTLLNQIDENGAIDVNKLNNIASTYGDGFIRMAVPNTDSRKYDILGNVVVKGDKAYVQDLDALKQTAKTNAALSYLYNNPNGQNLKNLLTGAPPSVLQQSTVDALAAVAAAQTPAATAATGVNTTGTTTPAATTPNPLTDYAAFRALYGDYAQAQLPAIPANNFGSLPVDQYSGRYLPTQYVQNNALPGEVAQLRGLTDNLAIQQDLINRQRLNQSAQEARLANDRSRFNPYVGSQATTLGLANAYRGNILANEALKQSNIQDEYAKSLGGVQSNYLNALGNVTSSVDSRVLQRQELDRQLAQQALDREQNIRNQYATQYLNSANPANQLSLQSAQIQQIDSAIAGLTTAKATIEAKATKTTADTNTLKAIDDMIALQNQRKLSILLGQ